MVGGGDDGSFRLSIEEEGTNKIHGVILILKRIIESVPEVYSLSKLLLHLESDDSAQVAHNVLSSFRITADSPHVGGRFLHAVSAAFGDFFKPGGFYAGLRDLTAPLHLFSSISLLPLGLTAKLLI
ncbi:unnamed protein product [Brassica napus]|uniref:(rape) hypothetical protein n=1 Tax=Brassica napus TaxID=3708 RepID=A0A816N881_BRANA|nr:unnamed protein product [Brassica napus]